VRRPSTGDWGGAIALSLGLHVGLVLLVLLGYFLSRLMPSSPPPGAAISAELVDGKDLSAAMRKTLRNRPEPVVEPEPLPEPEPEPVEPEPLPEPVEEQPRPQDFIPVPDEVDQQEVVDVPTPLPAKEDKVQEAKQRQAQVDLTEMERQKQEQQKAEEQRLKRIAEIQRQRKAAAAVTAMEDQRLQQIANARARNAAQAAAQADATASAATPPGAGGHDADLQGRYAAAIQAAVLAKWSRPESVALGTRCKVVIRQIRGGSVIDAHVTSPCELDEAGRRSVEAAVLKAQPLPYAGFEPVFQRELTLNFRAEDR
jgi:colicin import membrane protein